MLPYQKSHNRDHNWNSVFCAALSVRLERQCWKERGGCIPGCLWQGNFKEQDLNGCKKTSAVRQWMAKENREAEHMLGHNDKKKQKQTQKRKRHKWEEHDYSKIMRRASANKQLKQCFHQAPSVHPWRALLLFADYVETGCYRRERKHNSLLRKAV